MKKNTRLGFITFFIPFIFLFQNCDHHEEASLQATETTLESLGVHTLHISTKDLNSPRTPTSTKKQASAQEELMVIDLYNSVIKNSQGVHYCPGYDFFYSLRHILDQARLCVTASSEDVVCSTEYTPSKAILITQGGEQIALGRRDDQCKQMDLCAPSQDDFNVLIEMFLEIKDSFKCTSI